MAEPKVCVSLEAISVEEMIDEATRANIAGADYVEVRFDKLYLNKPEPVISTNNDGEEISKIPPIEECCLLYTSPSPRDLSTSRMPSSA